MCILFGLLKTVSSRFFLKKNLGKKHVLLLHALSNSFEILCLKNLLANSLLKKRLHQEDFKKWSSGEFRGKGTLTSFAKFKVKHLCRSVFFNKVGGLPRCFPVNFAKFAIKNFSYRTSLVAASEFLIHARKKEVHKLSRGEHLL